MFVYFGTVPGTDGYVQFTGLPERRIYTLKVVAETYEGEITIIKRQFRIGFRFHMHPTSEMHDTVTLTIIVNCGNTESWNY